MSDVMLFDVLRMPYAMAMSSELSRRQFYERAQEAANRLEGLDAEKWMPIETAPKDSKARLVWCPSRKNIYAVCWDKRGDGCWMFFGGGGSLTEEPTHWMPLPPPPTDRRTPEQST